MALDTLKRRNIPLVQLAKRWHDLISDLKKEDNGTIIPTEHWEQWWMDLYLLEDIEELTKNE